MRASPLAAALFLSLIAAPAVAQDFLGRLAQSSAEAAARRLANRAVDAATRPRPATPPAARPAAPPPAARPAAPPPAARPAAPAATAAPAAAAATTAAPAPAEASAASGASITVRNKMAVMSSDGVRVAEVMHVPNNERVYGPGEMFFTADTYYNLRRIYGREATVSGDAVHLKMTAAQFRARLQNPDDVRNP
ncbi:hypothetical protein [Brevundimonas sp.]|uniref:hypothetical protein n=1 Tax=Brevundimonas sp. TaxID=1871086 RepID=UPI0025BA7995|nr:hypothetical protein [Brevundimonas sp.]